MSDKPSGRSRRISSERLKRVLGLPGHGGSLSPGAKTTIFFGVLALLAAFVAWLDPRPSLRHVHVGILSGSQTGNYFAIVDKLADRISRQKGSVTNLSSAGSAENVRRLIDGRKRCDVHFALVQDGIAYPDNHDLELVGRLPRPESLIILGRNADRIRTPAELTGLRLGIGPGGSGTEQLMRHVLAPLHDLALVVSRQPIDQQLAMLERGELDLGAMVIDDEAKLVADAVKNRNLQILALPDAASLARRLPFTRSPIRGQRVAVGSIEASGDDFKALSGVNASSSLKRPVRVSGAEGRRRAGGSRLPSTLTAQRLHSKPANCHCRPLAARRTLAERTFGNAPNSPRASIELCSSGVCQVSRYVRPRIDVFAHGKVNPSLC